MAMCGRHSIFLVCLTLSPTILYVYNVALQERVARFEEIKEKRAIEILKRTSNNVKVPNQSSKQPSKTDHIPYQSLKRTSNNVQVPNQSVMPSTKSGYIPYQSLKSSNRTAYVPFQSSKTSNKIGQISYRPRTITYSQHSPNLTLILFSAIASNSSKLTIWDNVVVQGWSTPSIIKDHKFDCCVLYSSGALHSYKKVTPIKWLPEVEVELGAIQFQCNITGRDDGDLPVKVMVRATEGEIYPVCPKNYDSYVDIEFAYKQRGLAGFIKVIYSNLSHHDMISWFEIHRKLGVDRVYGYIAEDLNMKAQRVVTYYQRLGIFEPISYPIPRKISNMYGPTRLCWHLQAVAQLDSQVRAQGFDYLASFDIDEYLIPTRKDESLKDVLDRLFREHVNAAGFIFMTYVFVKDWGAQNQSPFSVEKYLNRTKAVYEKAKHVVKPRRVVLGSIHAHSFKARENYTKVSLNVEDVAIYHYHACDHNLFSRQKNGFCLNTTRIRDTRIADLFQATKSSFDII